MIALCRTGSSRATRERRSSGEEPQTRLIARANELADLKPKPKESSLIAISGCDAKRHLTRARRISSRTFLKLLPVEARIAFLIVRLLTRNVTETPSRLVRGLSCKQTEIFSKSNLS